MEMNKTDADVLRALSDLDLIERVYELHRWSIVNRSEVTMQAFRECKSVYDKRFFKIADDIERKAPSELNSEERLRLAQYIMNGRSVDEITDFTDLLKRDDRKVPSDEEINAYAKANHVGTYISIFVEGAEWMKNKMRVK